MTKRAASLALVAATASLLHPVSASAAEPSYEGTYTFLATCVSVCSGVFTHHLTIASYSAAAGSFSGTGYSVSPPTRWTITGTIKAGTVSFHIAYTAGNPGYTFDGTGTVAPDGSMSGTGTDFDRTRPAGTLTWTATKEAVPAGANGIDWRMPPRLSSELENQWGPRPWGLPPPLYVNQKSWKVELFLTSDGKPACPSGSEYVWHVSGRVVSKEVPGTGCRVEATVPELGVYDVTAEESPSGKVIENKHVVVRDWVIVGLGDSNGSGEGNPPWQFAQCDRSLASSQYQAAQYIEDHDPHSSVTLLFASCSGARTDHLWQHNYAGIQPNLGPSLPPQIAQVKSLLGERKVDAVIMSIGINDLRFSAILKVCVVSHASFGLACQYQCVERQYVADGFEYRSIPCHEYDPSSPNPTLARATSALVKNLPGHYRVLKQHLASELDPAHVFLTQYPDFSHDEIGYVCGGAKLEHPFPNFQLSVWRWLASTGEDLNAVVAGTSRLGWEPITGIPEDFLKHGYCSTDSYFVPLIKAVVTGLNGAFHPTGKGQEITLAHTRVAVCNALYGNPACDGIPPAP